MTVSYPPLMGVDIANNPNCNKRKSLGGEIGALLLKITAFICQSYLLFHEQYLRLVFS